MVVDDVRVVSSDEGPRATSLGSAAPRNGPVGSGLRSLDDDERVALRSTFDTDAERYAARRPTYPSALFDALAAYGDLPPGARVLEVAPGTGQATSSLAARGWAVTAVEIGAHMAALARQNLVDQPFVDVVTSAFEEWPLPAQPFDAVFCATAWHWLDPATRLVKATAAVRPGGSVAVVWTHHVAGGTSDFFTESQDCYRRWAFDAATTEDLKLPAEEDMEPFTAELAGSSLVTDVVSRLFPLEVTYRTGEYLELLGTYSAIAALDAGQREGLLECLGDLMEDRFDGQVTKRYAFELVLARRSA